MALPVLVRDIFPGNGDSFPFNLVAFNNGIVFTAQDGAFGGELWFSDGTTSGTRQIKDIVPGPNGSFPYFTIVVGQKIYFVADFGSGSELFVSDGTNAGTDIALDIYPGNDSSFPGSLTKAGSKLYFSANDGISGYELWVVLGPGIQPVKVKDVNPGALNGNPYYLFEFGSNILFSANNPNSGTELWISDGTSQGTRILKDIYQGNLSSDPYGFVNSPSGLNSIAKKVVFSALDGSGRELWVTDGTEAGTQQVLDINPGSFDSNPRDLTRAGNLVYFTAEDGVRGRELWAYDGNNASLVRDIMPGGVGSDPSNLTAVGNRIFFSAYTDSNNRELWTSDGTVTGTRLVKDIYAGAVESSMPSNFLAIGHRIFFSARDGSGTELWTSDGTESGTFLVQDINSGSNDSNPFNLASSGNNLFFAASNGIVGYELWKLDVSDLVSTFSVSTSTPQLHEKTASAGGFKFTVTRTGDLTPACAVKWQVYGSGSAPDDKLDFPGGLLPQGVINFASNESSKTIIVRSNNDFIAERNESLRFVLSNPIDGVLSAASSSAVATILNDDITSSVTYALAANDENLYLTGTAAINGTGNKLNNRLTGNAANNVLNGSTGADTMAGGLGNDTYIVDNAGDVVSEALNAGTDTVRSTVNHTLRANVENLLLTGTSAINGTGNTQNNSLTGNAANNVLNGGVGADSINGGGGNDTLIGGAGRDVLIGSIGVDKYVYSSVADSRVGSTVRDVITDYQGSAGERINLFAIDAYTKTTGNQAFTYIGSNAFTGTKGEVRFLGGVLQMNTGTNKTADMEIALSGVTTFSSTFLVL